MGHYYSEMCGEPFTTCKKLTDFKLAEKILRAEKLKFKKVIEFKNEWITTDTKRSWYEIVYTPIPKSNCNYTTTISEEDFLKYKKTLK